MKAREDEEARKQQEALEKFSKRHKAQRAKKEGRKNMDSSDDSMSDNHKKMFSGHDDESAVAAAMRKKSSMLSSSENDGDFLQELRRKKVSSSAGDMKMPGFSKKALVDSSDDSDSEIFDSLKQKASNGFQRGKPSAPIYSSDEDSPFKKHKKPKVNIYTDSESNTENKSKKMEGISPSRGSDSESEAGESKSSALAVLAKGKKKSPVKEVVETKKSKPPTIKAEPFSSESEAESKPLLADIKKEIKTEIKTEPVAHVKVEEKPKKKSTKKEKKRDKEPKEKEKSVLGKIFGTSSEDESFGRNSKPPTPNTSLNKSTTPNTTKSLIPKLSVDQVFSASDNEKDKLLDSPALMSDSEDDVRSRPPTPTFQTKKPEASETKTQQAAPVSSTSQSNQEEAKVLAPKPSDSKPKETTTVSLFSSSEDELADDKTSAKDKSLERSRRLSAHERQKQSENLFDSLLTVNVDLPPKVSRKSPGGSLKSPVSSKSPGMKSGGKYSESQKSPGSHRSPLISPGGKPTYLLAHAFNMAAHREAEKRHKAQEKEMNKGKPAEKKEALVCDTKNEVEHSAPEIKIIEEKVKPKLGLIEPVAKESDCEILTEKEKVSSTQTQEAAVAKDEQQQSHRKVSTDSSSSQPSSAEKKSSDSSSSVLAESNSSAASGYDVFAKGNLDATSSPSPASDYEEGRLVIGDGEETGSDNEVVAEEPATKPEIVEDAVSAENDEPEIIVEHVSKPIILTSPTETKPAGVKTPVEPTREEQLEKSIASITSQMETGSEEEEQKETTTSSESTDASQFEEVPESSVVEAEPQVKRTVISQEETESAVNALLGESFDSFDTEEPSVNNTTPENMEVDQPAADPVDDEAASAVAGLGIEMLPEEQSPQRDWQAGDAPAKVEPHETEPLKKEETQSPPVETQSSKQESNDLQTTKEQMDEKKVVEDSVELDEPVARGRGRVRGRGRAGLVNVVQTSTPVGRGRGRGARAARQTSPEKEQPNQTGEAEPAESVDHVEPARGKVRGGRGGRGQIRGGFKKLLNSTPQPVEDKSHDVFEFQGSDDEGKAPESLKSSPPLKGDKKVEQNVEPDIEAVAVTRTPGRGRGRGGKTASAVPQTSPTTTSTVASVQPTNLVISTQATVPLTISTTAATVSLAQTMSPMQSSPALPGRLSTEEKLSPAISPGSAKSPRTRRSTGGKSRESEEESADTDQKIKLILEQAKQEAAQQAAAHHLVSMPGFSLPVGIPITAGVGQTSSGPLSSPQSVVHAVSSPVLSASQTNVLIRTGIPQPTVLPPRHDQQVRSQPRPVAPVRAPVNAAAPVISGPRASLPIQLPTQPLPPESIRKTQPVLLEQNQPSPKHQPSAAAPRTTIAVSLPTEPIPRSVALPTAAVPANIVRMPKTSVITTVPRMPAMPVASVMARMPVVVSSLARLPLPSPAPLSTAVAGVSRMPLSTEAAGSSLARVQTTPSAASLPRMPVSSAAAVIPRQPVPLVVTTQSPVPRNQVPVSVSRAPIPVSRAPPSTNEGQRVSLQQRDGVKEPEMDQKTREQILLDAMHSGQQRSQQQQQQQQPVKREYLLPREQDQRRPASTPLSTPDQIQAKDEEKAGYELQQPYDAQALEMYNLRNYLCNQLMSAGHTRVVALQYAQSLLRERFMEEPRPGSVPPIVHHLEEERRQPLPAHSSGPYRQTDSPLYHLPPAHNLPPAHSGSQHTYHSRDTVGPPTAHMDQFRRDDMVPPAAHSSQIKRLTHSAGVTDFSTNKAPSPQHQLYASSNEPSVTDYRMWHLAAYPICWSGILGLKNDMANVQMHYVSGCRDLAREYLPQQGSNLKIVQRMRLEDAQIDGVKKKMDTKSEHCMLLALPHGSDLVEIEKQSKILRNNFITYLQLKSAAGIANVVNEENKPAIVHVFPSCDFANENLAR